MDEITLMDISERWAKIAERALDALEAKTALEERKEARIAEQQASRVETGAKREERLASRQEEPKPKTRRGK